MGGGLQKSLFIHQGSKWLWSITASLLVFWPVLAHAVTWDTRYNSWSQIRKERFPLNIRTPIDQYIGFGFSELPRDFGFNTNFRVFTDPTRPAQQFDLYEAVLHIEPASHFTMDGGRQWNVDGFNADLLDALKLGLFPEGSFVGGSLFGGVPRYPEDGNFHNVMEGLNVGLNLNLQNVENTSLQFSAKWNKVDATRTSWKRNDTIYVGLVGSHQFEDVWAQPNIYGNVEYDIAANTFDVGTFGIDLYPHWRVALTLEGNRFDVSRSSREQTVFGNSFTGSIRQAREALQIKIAKSLHFFEDFSYQRYNVAGRGGENGYTANAGFEHFWKAAKFSTLAQYYYFKSYGGTVNGGYVHFSDSYFKNWLFELGVDVSRYSKITGQKSTPVSVVGDVAYLINDRCRFSLGGEFNHNIWFNREGRATVNLELNFDKKDYHPEKRSKKINRRFHEI